MSLAPLESLELLADAALIQIEERGDVKEHIRRDAVPGLLPAAADIDAHFEFADMLPAQMEGPCGPSDAPHASFFSCDVCSRQFTQKRNLRRHESRDSIGCRRTAAAFHLQALARLFEVRSPRTCFASRQQDGEAPGPRRVRELRKFWGSLFIKMIAEAFPFQEPVKAAYDAWCHAAQRIPAGHALLEEQQRHQRVAKALVSAAVATIQDEKHMPGKSDNKVQRAAYAEASRTRRSFRTALLAFLSAVPGFHRCHLTSAGMWVSKDEWGIARKRVAKGVWRAQVPPSRKNIRRSRIDDKILQCFLSFLSPNCSSVAYDLIARVLSNGTHVLLARVQILALRATLIRR
jgi:hypothetical protein